MPRGIDTNRIAKAHTPLGGTLLFREMSGREELSRPYEYRLELLAEENPAVDPKAVLGRSMTVEVEIQGGGSRFIDGQCVSFAYVGAERSEERNTTFYRYEARLRPWLWYLSYTSNCRIFQNKTVPEILSEVLAEYPFTNIIQPSKSYRTWEYCVQYQETDLNFVSRLMEHEGLYYWFEHELGSHTLVIADDIGAHVKVPGYAVIPHIPPDMKVIPDEEWISDWQMAQDVVSGLYVMRDFDFKHPSGDLTVINTNALPYPPNVYERYEYPGGYWTIGDGEQYARSRLEETQHPQELTSFMSNARGLAAGYRFNLERCPRRDQNREYLLLAVETFIRDNPYTSGINAPAQWRFQALAQPSVLPYRPRRVTPKPRTHGPQTAVVVGPKGEDIWTDEHGRVKVHFHWDRYGLPDENASCWIRVSSGWAGSNWGMISLPRIGQEVIVDFIHGDADYPIIVGRVYNAEHKPPYVLPRWKEYSTWKSRSTKEGGNNDWNEIRFYDFKGKEQVFIQAQWRMDVRVKWNKYETVRESSHFLMGACYATTGGNYELHAKGKIYQRSNSDTSMTAGGKLFVQSDGDMKVGTDSTAEFNAKGKIIVESSTSLTLKATGGFVKIDASGVTIEGTMVKINCGSFADSTTPVDAEHPYDASEADHGEPGYLDRPKTGGGWPKRGSSRLGHHRAIPPKNPLPPPNTPVKGTPGNIDPGANSIVCRGGKLTVQNNNTGPDRASTQAHEEGHAADWKARYGENLCAGVPDGQLPMGGDGYAEFLRQSECKSYRIGKAHREQQLETASAADKPAIEAAIARDNAQLAANKCG